MQMLFSNNSIQAALEGERKRMLLIAREQAGGKMGRWVHSMVPFRNQACGAASRGDDIKRRVQYIQFKVAETTAWQKNTIAL